MTLRFFIPWLMVAGGLLMVTARCARVGFNSAPTADSGSDGFADGQSDLDLVLPPSFTALTLPFGGTIDEIVLHPAHPSTLYVFSAGGRVFRSADRGAGWTECARPPSRDINAITLAADEAVYINMFDDVLESRDQCASWRGTGGPPKVNSLIATARGDIFATNDQGLWLMRDDVWSKLTVPTGDASLKALAADPTGEVIFAGSPTAGLLRSVNGGEDWVITVFPLGREVHQLLIDPEDPDRVYVAARTGLYRSPNGGDTWELVRAGDAYTVALKGDLLVMEGPSGIFESTDGGNIFAKEDRRGVEMAKSRSRLLFAPDEPGRLYAAGGRGLFTIKLPSAGTWQWESRHTGITAWSVFGIAQQTSPPTLHLGTSAGVLRSEDQDASWSLKGGFSQYSLVNDCAVDSTAPSGVLLVAGNDLLRSEDHGLSFARLLTAGAEDYWSYQSIAFHQGRYILGSQERVIFYSPSDSTQEVQALGRQAQDLLVVEGENGQLLLVATGDGLLTVELSLPHAVGETLLAGDVRAIVHDSAGNLYAGTRSGVRQASGVHDAWQSAGLEQHQINDLLLTADLLIAATHRGLYTKKLADPAWQSVPDLEGLNVSELALDHHGHLLVGTIGFNLYRGPLPR